MKHFRNSVCLAATAAVACFFATGSGPRADQTDAQNQALDLLNQRNIYFSDEEFVDLVNRGDADNVSLFIRAGMNPNTTTEGSELPVHIVSLKGHAETLRVLLDGGAFPDIRNGKGWTPLMLSTLMEHAECVNILLEKNADVNLQNGEGISALMLAVQERNMDIARALIKSGADPGVKNAAGVSAISIAIGTKQDTMLSFFEKSGYARAVATARKELGPASKKRRASKSNPAVSSRK